jgi:hypothetical protein
MKKATDKNKNLHKKKEHYRTLHNALNWTGQNLIAPAGPEEPPATELMPAAELMPAGALSPAVIPARGIGTHVRTFV